MQRSSPRKAYGSRKTVHPGKGLALQRPEDHRAVLPMAASPACPHPASPRREQGGEAENHRSYSTPMPRHPCFGLPFKNAKPDKGDKIPRSRVTGGVLSRQGWWSPEKSSPSTAESPGPRWSLQMGEAGLSQRYTLCCRGWGWGRNSGCHSTVVRKGQRTPWECSETA